MRKPLTPEDLRSRGAAAATDALRAGVDAIGRYGRPAAMELPANRGAMADDFIP